MPLLDPVEGLRLLETGEYSDFVIECKGREWKAHKLVLGTASSHLERLCYGQFKVNLPVFTCGSIV
jgi:BTB/POZ domain